MCASSLIFHPTLENEEVRNTTIRDGWGGVLKREPWKSNWNGCGYNFSSASSTQANRCAEYCGKWRIERKRSGGL